MVWAEPFDKTMWDFQIKLRRVIDIPEELKKLDVIIFHCPHDLVFLERLDKPSIFYNHRSARPYTFMFKEILKHIEPMRRAVLIKDDPYIIEQHKYLYSLADVIVSNSKFTQGIMKRVFGFDSFVCYPPVDTKKFKPAKNPSRDFYFSVQRINWQKRVDLQIEIFKELKDEKLIIAGGPLEGYDYNVKRLCEDLPNVEYVGGISDREVIKYMQNAKAVIQTCYYEDFGLVPVEALACGTPVIVTDEGGFKETIHSEKLGIRVRKPYIQNFREAIKKFDVDKFDPKLLRKEAEKYSEERFKKEMQHFIKLAIERHEKRRTRCK